MRDIANRAPRNYELMTILHPEVTEEELPGAIEQVAGYVTAADGTIEETLRESPWGRRRLAYPIRHGGRDLRDGYYTVYHLHLAPNRVEEVERELKLNERVMRYLMTSYEPIPVDPKVLEQREIDAEDAAAAAYVAAAAAAAATAAASAEAETAAAVLEANSDATDAPATVAANEAVDLPVDTESARIADEAEAVAESTADAVDVTTAAEADLAAQPAATSDDAAMAEAGTVATADEATDASAGAGAAPAAAGDQG